MGISITKAERKKKQQEEFVTDAVFRKLNAAEEAEAARRHLRR
jgi:hypothetical protein